MDTTIPPTVHPEQGAPDPTPDEATFLDALTGPAPTPPAPTDRFTPSGDEVQQAKSDIIAHVIPGRLSLTDVANAMLAERAALLADDVAYGQDPALNVPARGRPSAKTGRIIRRASSRRHLPHPLPRRTGAAKRRRPA